MLLPAHCKKKIYCVRVKSNLTLLFEKQRNRNEEVTKSIGSQKNCLTVEVSWGRGTKWSQTVNGGKWTRVFENVAFFKDCIDSTYANNNLLLEPKFVIEKIGEFLGYQDITFQGPWRDSNMKCTQQNIYY